MAWGVADQIKVLEKLLSPGLIGMYRSFEVTELIGFRADISATNFFSLLVAEPGEPPATTPKRPFLNSKPIPLEGTPWKFGVSRYRVSTQRLLDVLRRFHETGEWKPGANALRVGNLTAIPSQFVPSDSYQVHSWNGVLKNNFWDGSHVLELFDTGKNDVRFLLTEPKLLGRLAEHLRSYAPIGLDGLSDRLGNVVIQLPVTVCVTKFGSQEKDEFLLEPAWHPQAKSRPLRVSWEIYEDGTVESFTSREIRSKHASVPIHSRRRGARYVVWDDSNEVIVGASAPMAFFGNSVTIRSSTMSSVSREFMVPHAGDEFVGVTIPVSEEDRPNPDHRPHSNPREPWRSNRVFKQSLHGLQQNKEFVQYGGPANLGRDEAIEDIRWLLRRHGRAGAWLWDPYLDVRDLLCTLFFCPYKDADLRALTSASELPSRHKVGSTALRTTAEVRRCWLRFEAATKWFRAIRSEDVTDQKSSQLSSWKQRQLETIQATQGNCAGLRLEFRMRTGNAGWPFHDRFLIFPCEPGGALAWSLGTSINSFGRKHHILQKVPDGELIRQAFLQLWDALSAPDHLVWKTP